VDDQVPRYGPVRAPVVAEPPGSRLGLLRCLASEHRLTPPVDPQASVDSPILSRNELECAGV